MKRIETEQQGFFRSQETTSATIFLQELRPWGDRISFFHPIMGKTPGNRTMYRFLIPGHVI
jgi:hypothetical protein